MLMYSCIISPWKITANILSRIQQCSDVMTYRTSHYLTASHLTAHLLLWFVKMTYADKVKQTKESNITLKLRSTFHIINLNRNLGHIALQMDLLSWVGQSLSATLTLSPSAHDNCFSSSWYICSSLTDYTCHLADHCIDNCGFYSGTLCEYSYVLYYSCVLGRCVCSWRDNSYHSAGWVCILFISGHVWHHRLLACLCCSALCTCLFLALSCTANGFSRKEGRDRAHQSRRIVC